MSITAVILTFNEEIHLARCLASLSTVCERICIIDSFSTDRTCEIAKEFGADVFQHVWENNHSKQLNWGLSVTQISSMWTIRLDADEYLSQELQAEIKAKLVGVSLSTTGIEFTRKVYFKGTWIRHGGFYPIHLLRLWRTGRGVCEQRLMDEHIMLDGGEVIRFKEHVVDENLNSIHWWVIKHNNYARREAADALNLRYQFMSNSDLSTVKQAVTKRKTKNGLYHQLPLGLRAFAYFILRFVFQLGFLDGPKVWVFHFMQGFWYRLLVDVNIYEAEKQAKGDKEILRKIISADWKIEL